LRVGIPAGKLDEARVKTLPGRRLILRPQAATKAGLQKLPAEQDVLPQVGINRIFGEMKNRDAKNAEDEFAAQHGMRWRGWHSEKIAAAGGKKIFYSTDRSDVRNRLVAGPVGKPCSVEIL
jgi:hypothetical protein